MLCVLKILNEFLGDTALLGRSVGISLIVITRYVPVARDIPQRLDSLLNRNDKIAAEIVQFLLVAREEKSQGKHMVFDNIFLFLLLDVNFTE